MRSVRKAATVRGLGGMRVGGAWARAGGVLRGSWGAYMGVLRGSWRRDVGRRGIGSDLGAGVLR